MGTWQITACLHRALELSWKMAGLPAGSTPSARLAVDAWYETGRIWLVRLVPGDPQSTPGAWTSSGRSGPRYRRPPEGMRHAGPLPRDLLFAAVWVVVA